MSIIHDLEETLNEQFVEYQKLDNETRLAWVRIEETRHELEVAIEEEAYLTKRSNQARRAFFISVGVTGVVLFALSLWT